MSTVSTAPRAGSLSPSLENAPLQPLPDRGGPAQPMLIARELHRSFRVSDSWLGARTVVRAVDNISLTVRKGETLGVVGESGCGKSTLAKLLAGIESFDRGEVIVDGESAWVSSNRMTAEARRSVQMVFQDSYSSLNPRMSILDTVTFGPRAHGIAPDRAREYGAELLGAVGLPPERFAERYPIELSGGQRQRVNIARAIALRPRLLLLDEPVSALDKSIEAQVLNLLVRMRDELGLSYVFISHDLNVIRYVADRVVVMYLGRIVEEAPTEALFSSARHPYTKALLASRPTLDPRHRIGRPPIDGDPPDPTNPPSGCRFRTRCRLAETVCAEKDPDLGEIAGSVAGHRAACWAEVPGSGHSMSAARLS